MVSYGVVVSYTRGTPVQSVSAGAQKGRLPLEMLPLDPRGPVAAALPP